MYNYFLQFYIVAYCFYVLASVGDAAKKTKIRIFVSLPKQTYWSLGLND